MQQRVPAKENVRIARQNEMLFMTVKMERRGGITH
jgi:hypothetical protein